jgi:hypothetical protein
MIRVPKLLSDTKTAGDTVGVWLNTIKTGAPLSVYEPTALDLTFVDINDDQKLIDDIWDGFLQTQAVPDGLGKFYIPSIGDTVQDAATSNSAEVAYVKVIAFNILQIYIKNKTGAFSLGSEFGASANLTLIGSPNRTVGVIQRSELGDAVVGKLFVFDHGSVLQPTTNSAYHYVNDLEYYLYDEITQDGVSRAASVPSRINRDYEQVFNIPAGLGYTSALTNQGLFLVYERLTNGNYALTSSYLVPDMNNGTNLGLKTVLRQHNAVTRCM